MPYAPGCDECLGVLGFDEGRSLRMYRPQDQRTNGVVGDCDFLCGDGSDESRPQVCAPQCDG